VQSELFAGFLRSLGRDHHAGAVGELRDQRREWRLQHEPDRQRIDDIDVVECGKLRLAERGRQRKVAVEREFCGFRVERLAVVELDASPQLDRHFPAVGGSLMG
jgi:hypothetical protein